MQRVSTGKRFTCDATVVLRIHLQFTVIKYVICNFSDITLASNFKSLPDGSLWKTSRFDWKLASPAASERPQIVILCQYSAIFKIPALETGTRMMNFVVVVTKQTDPEWDGNIIVV